ncbi:DUF2807 domain-containing protein [Fulvivirga sp. 29W222]|uniref:DUF2807 domain-containing protein n=1 Tax=Fulvivirga marina TaxID=2494733 RepID=A0A937KEI5_9BACT|nr:head GIN domain-containing protein [Fulvivirga marina]MBL6447213.1 DUF2807 domain-containing protein [Fulvivirga marina]
MTKAKTLLLILFSLSTISLLAQQSEIREVSSFKELSLSTAGKVHLTQGSTQKVELKGSKDVLDNTETEVRGGRLIIKRKNSSWFGGSNGDLEILITMTQVEELNVSSSGKIYGENMIKTDDLEVSVSGSGSVELNTMANDLDLSISGSGKILLEGTAKDVDISISGSGSLKAEELKSDSYKIKISGSGSCKVYAEKSIDASISGSGSVYYKGNPENVNSRSSGSGRIRKI